MRRASHFRWALLVGIFCAGAVIAQQRMAQTKPIEARAITGRVVTESGQPLPGVSVVARSVDVSTAQRTSTDNEGHFKLQQLDAGLYRLSANLPGYVSDDQEMDPNDPETFYRPGDSVTLTLVKGGVITGVVTDTSGEPVVAVTIRAFRVRDAEGRKLSAAGISQSRVTDDRGYYRIYGLLPGSYIVAAGGQGQYFGMVNPFANDAPTFAPASTRDTAAEITVDSDQEAEVNIRYRSEPGQAISGKLIGALTPLSDTAIRLKDLEARVAIASAPPIGEDRGFQLSGVPDGEYEIAAIGSDTPNVNIQASLPRRVRVKGADLTGLELFMAPMGSISGRVVFEPHATLNCGSRRDSVIRETMLVSRRDSSDKKAAVKNASEKQTEVFDSSLFPASLEVIPNEKGEIIFRNLLPATYRLEVHAPAAGWYVRDLNLGSVDRASAKSSGANVAMNGIKVAAGAKITGLTVSIAEGGASLRGRITAAREQQSLPPNLRLYLVPAERDNRGNVQWFFEETVRGDGTFEIENIAPGRYWVISQLAEATLGSLRTDGALRARISREAEALKKEIVLKPCERIVDYEFPM
jgi:hypothetical protein